MGTFLIILQVVIVLGCLLLGTHYGGVGLGLISGIGLALLVFFFQLPPGEPPIDVMLTILAVIGCASVLQTIGGLDVMMKYAEKLLRKHPTRVTILAPLTTWFLTVLCGTGHVVYTMFPIIEDISLSKNIRPERPLAVSSVAAQMGITARIAVAAEDTAAPIPPEHEAPLAAEEAGNLDEAITLWERVVELNPRDEDAKSHLSRVRLAARSAQADATDPAARADALFAAGDAAGAFNVLLDLLAATKDDEERDALRLRLLDLFRVAGSTPEVSKARTRLAMLLM